MSLWHIAWSYLWNRKLTTIMTILSVGLGVGLISAVLTLREETRKRFEEEGQAFDLVVGAKGNPLQLVLSTVYFLDAPTGAIPYSDYERLKQEEEVEAAFPIGMGDSYPGGYRIVGTLRELFEYDWGSSRVHPYELDEGRYFENPLEAVIGATVASETNLGLGSSFYGSHGFVPGLEVHKEHPYTVVGILKRSATPNDRAIFCDLESVWLVHAHSAEDEGVEHDHSGHAGVSHEIEGAEGEQRITAVLVRLLSPALRFQTSRRFNHDYNAMAVIPILEIQKLYDQFLGVAKAVLLAIGYLVVVISAISILIGLYMAILQRRRDLAVMRALGASRGEIFGSVIIEALWVSSVGLGAGWVLGSLTCWVLGAYLSAKVGFTVSAITFAPDLITAYSAVVVMGLLAGVLPAWQAYRSDVARDLAEL
jgi:putative ABC transport system permease protein